MVGEKESARPPCADVVRSEFPEMGATDLCLLLTLARLGLAATCTPAFRISLTYRRHITLSPCLTTGHGTTTVLARTAHKSRACVPAAAIRPCLEGSQEETGREGTRRWRYKGAGTGEGEWSVPPIVSYSPCTAGKAGNSITLHDALVHCVPAHGVLVTRGGCCQEDSGGWRVRAPGKPASVWRRHEV